MEQCEGHEYGCSLCFDSQVAAVQQSPEFRFGIRKNAKMDNGKTQRRNLFSSQGRREQIALNMWLGEEGGTFIKLGG